MTGLTKIFKNDGVDFSGFTAAKSWIRKEGYICGSMQGNEPIGVHRETEAEYISKWRKMTSREHRELDGKIVSVGGFRKGDARVELSGGPAS